MSLELDSLSSKKWSSKKEKASKRAADHAAEILDIESRRLNSLANSLKIDDKVLKDFENDFPYVETPDQSKSFNEIRKDLSLVKPMNRVLCGDVGFGKTEVAMKSAFVAVNSNKQIIVITPSTILSDQHYNSFLERFRNFGVTIAKINRFVSKDKKDQIINDFHLNKVDILIATHIVFNNDINFNNTGLLIIDEEHKFGIKQKNFIKNKQENIHILYLSATPIPKTMNMVFSGLKDFSFLQTSPSNRINIKSFLKINTNQVFKEALIREKSRGGQCFIVQNDIDKIQQTKKEINHMLPNYKLGVAHGRLNKKDIKKVMSDFKSGLLDGLICTTIVEMGLDIPNANTMIIINSQNFGLSQLHQLRGRVGRSNRQAYCYFLIPDMEIPKISRARLDSIIRYSNLGEGFMIAQQDLEIRGGGEMLGEKQSGHINNVGMSLYLSMLKSALQEPSLKYLELDNMPEVNFNDSAYINSSYLPSPIERLKIYRKINDCASIDALNKISKDLIDRCGVMPVEVTNLIHNKRISLRIYQTGIKSIKSNPTNTNFKLTDKLKDSILNKLLKLISNNNIYSINKENKFIYKNNEIDSEVRRKNVNLLLDEIL
jgi:transcription-repair coupling factor (superfamily II helicase)